MKMTLGDATRSVTMLSVDDSPLFKLQDLCDGISREQYRLQQITRDKTILTARERVLSARSKTSDAISLRSNSRLSSVRTNRERNSARELSIEKELETNAENEHDVGSVSGSSNENKQLVPVTPESRGSHPGSPEPSEYAQSTYRSEADGNMRVSDEDLTKLSYLDDNNPLLCSYASLSGVPVVPTKSRCVRSKSAVDREVEGMVRSLSRHCCDVLGPKVCHECALLKRRLRDSSRHEVCLSKLHVSEKNYADSIVLSKLLPHLSPQEIEDRVVSGDISRMPLRERIYETKQRVSSERRRLSSSASSTRSLSERRFQRRGNTATPFFVNIQDLNCKLLVGKFTNKISNRGVYETDSQNSSLGATYSLSAQSTASAEPPKILFKQYYEPPLLPKICQKGSPSFFAGSQGSYKLPDRLPDTAVEGQITDMSSFDAAWTGSYPQSEVEEDTK